MRDGANLTIEEEWQWWYNRHPEGAQRAQAELESWARTVGTGGYIPLGLQRPRRKRGGRPLKRSS